MPDRERIIQHFEDCIGLKPNSKSWVFVRVDMLRQTLKLLKEQEPRMLSLEEVRNNYAVVWLETIYCTPELCLIDHGESDSKWLRVTYGIDNGGQKEWSRYNKTWRCWSSRPTDEQREGTPWQG